MAKIKKILVPTDFSENASSGYKLVRDAAEKYKAKVDLVHVIHRPHYFNITRDALGNPFEDKDNYSRLREAAQERLHAEMQEQFGEENRGKVVVLNEDQPAIGIKEFAKNEKYDLIVMASRGYHQSMFTRGSVTEKLIRLINIPILTVNKGFDPKINTIVVPTDGSAVSLEALPMALLIAAQNKADIHLLSVSKVEGVAVKVAGESLYKYTDKQLKNRIFESLENFVSNESNQLEFVQKPSEGEGSFQLKNEAGEEVSLSIKIEKGISAHASIVEYARKHAQLVVIATHGRSGMANLFLGSVTEKVVRHLKLPVMTIKPEFAKKRK